MIAVVLSSVAALPAQAQTAAEFAAARKRMVDEAIVGAGVTHPRVIEAMLATPRHEFVALNLRRQAYFDMALPIGDNQTISSPFIVAYMTQSLDPQPSDRVLEIGTGSGYQAAVLSPLVREVYTIEIVSSLGRRAEATLRRLRYANVHVRIGDGYQGWPEKAPFDKIIVTCSPERVPRPLVDQLAEGGRLVIPVGERYQQTLYLFRKRNGQLEAEALQPTLFVPMTGRAEEARQVQPDPSKVVLVNGSFEERAAEEDATYIPGWYYERHFEQVDDRLSPDGERHVVFRNDEEGRSAHLLQGLAIDGRKVSEVELSAHVRGENIVRGRARDEIPIVAITFYDQNRRDLGLYWIGPWQGTFDWQRESARIRVPTDAREAIVRVGLFGATGTLAVDNVRLTAAGQ